jgi:hypothetical protein
MDTIGCGRRQRRARGRRPGAPRWPRAGRLPARPRRRRHSSPREARTAGRGCGKDRRARSPCMPSRPVLATAVGTPAGERTSTLHMVHVHGNALDDAEWEALVRSGDKVSISVDSELNMGMGRPVFERCRRHGLAPTLSADVISLNSDDLWHEMRFGLASTAGTPPTRPTSPAPCPKLWSPPAPDSASCIGTDPDSPSRSRRSSRSGDAAMNRPGSGRCCASVEAGRGGREQRRGVPAHGLALLPGEAVELQQRLLAGLDGLLGAARHP